MQSIFGLQLSQPLVYAVAFAVILLLMAVFAWVLRKIVGSSKYADGGMRGRQPRLGIVDSFPLDRQRQLVIVRRDSAEHLLLVGGTSDIVIETNIVRALSTAQQRDSGPSLKPQSPQPLTGKMNTGAELSFAPEPSAPAPLTPPPVQTAPALRPSDLAEIANRFQSNVVTPITGNREEALGQPAPTPFPSRLATSLPRAENEPAPLRSIDSEPIIPAEERAVKSVTTDIAPSAKLPAANNPEAAPRSRDIGSLNDSLRQLLGRSVEN